MLPRLHGVALPCLPDPSGLCDNGASSLRFYVRSATHRRCGSRLGFSALEKRGLSRFPSAGCLVFLVKEPPKNLCQTVAPRVQRDPKRKPMAFARAIRRPPIVAPEGVHFDLG